MKNRILIEIRSRLNLRKIVGYYRPCDFITMLSTVLAFFGMFLITNGHYTFSAIVLALCGICDGLDGKVARKRKYKKIENTYGIQLDSLSDVISFGVFPAFLTATICNNTFVTVLSCFYLLCGLVRLAYFNTLAVSKTSKKNVFIGLPITTVAIVYPIVICLLKIFNYNLITTILPIIMFILSILFIVKIEIPKIDIVGYLGKIFNKYTVNFIFFPIFIIIASDIYYKFNISNFNSILNAFNTISKHLLPFLLLYIIASLITIILSSLFKNTKRAQIIIMTLILIFMVVNDIKFAFMEIPIQTSDVNYFNKENMEMMTTAAGEIGSWIIVTILKTIVFIVLDILIIKFNKKYIYEFNNIILRLITIIASTSLLVLVIINNNNFKLKNIYNFSTNDLLQVDNTAKLYYDYGYFEGLYLDNMANSYLEPNDYSKKDAKKILKDVKKDNSINWGKANVVVILSEAFSDAENIKEIKFNKNLTSNLDKYSKDDDKLVFDLLVSPIGGKSVNSEFEVLTGGSLTFFKEEYIPYTQYFNEKHAKIVPHLIKEFDNNGYHTMYLTPWGKYSYKSEYVYNLINTDKMIYGDSLKGKKKGQFYSDKSFMDDIYDNLNTKTKEKYKFIMCATGQNHFSYQNKYKESDYDIKVTDTSFNEEDTALLRAYAQGIYDADKNLDYLYKKIQTLDTPTIIVFFGDHLPNMTNSKGKNVYLTSSYFNTSDKYINEIRKHTTKGAILANFDLNTSDNLKFINASYLGTYVANKMYIELSDYFKFVDYSRKITPVFNRNTYYDYENKIAIPIKKLDRVKHKNINNYRNVQHYAFYDGE